MPSDALGRALLKAATTTTNPRLQALLIALGTSKERAEFTTPTKPKTVKPRA